MCIADTFMFLTCSNKNGLRNCTACTLCFQESGSVAVCQYLAHYLVKKKAVQEVHSVRKYILTNASIKLCLSLHYILCIGQGFAAESWVCHCACCQSRWIWGELVNSWCGLRVVISCMHATPIGSKRSNGCQNASKEIGNSGEHGWGCTALQVSLIESRCIHFISEGRTWVKSLGKWLATSHAYVVYIL